MKRLVWVWSLVLASALTADPLTLDSYLGQVKSKHDGVKASKLTSEAAKERSGEGSLPYSFQLFSNAQYTYDHRPTFAPAFQGTLTRTSALSLGVSKLTDFGLQAKLSQELVHVQLDGTTPGLVNQTSFIDTAPKLEISQSLLKNGFGSETEAQAKTVEANALRTHYDQAFQVKRTLADAEALYWRLVVARELVAITEDSVQRANKIKDWSAARTRNDLADRADFLQATAALKLREFELKAAVQDLRVLSRAFNAARGVDGDVVEETLPEIEEGVVDKLMVPERVKFREDVLAAQQGSKVAEAQALLGEERNKPTLDVYGTAALYGRNPAVGQAFNTAYQGGFPYIQAGVRFAMPLDRELVNNDRAAYVKEKQAAELQVARRVFDQESEWKDLSQKLTEAKVRFDLLREIEGAQKTKSDYERDRLRKGRSTFFQTLQFEQEYANSRLNRIRLEGEVLALVAQIKTFAAADGGTNESR